MVSAEEHVVDAMVERQAAWRRELCLLIRMAEATGTEVGPVLAEALADDLRVMASVNKDLAARYALIVIQDLLSAVNPVHSPLDVTQYRH